MSNFFKLLCVLTVLMAYTSRVLSVFKKTIHTTPGTIIQLSCRKTNATLTNWYKDNVSGPRVMSYKPSNNQITYGTQWKDDASFTQYQLTYELSIKLKFPRDQNSFWCVGITGGQTKVLAIYSLFLEHPPSIHYLIKNSVRVGSYTLLLTEGNTIKLELATGHISAPFHVNWMVEDTDVTKKGTDKAGKKLDLLVTRDMHEKDLTVTIVNRLGTATLTKHIHVADAPFFVNPPRELTITPGGTNVLEIKFQAIPRITKHQWFRNDVVIPTTPATSYVLYTNVTIPLHGSLVVTPGYKAVLEVWGGDESTGVYTLTVENGFGLVRTKVDVKYDVSGGGDGCCTCGNNSVGAGGKGPAQKKQDFVIAISIVSVILAMTVVMLVVMCVMYAQARRSNSEKAEIAHVRKIEARPKCDLPHTGLVQRYSQLTDAAANHETSHSNNGSHGNGQSGGNTRTDNTPNGNTADIKGHLGNAQRLDVKQPAGSHGNTQTSHGKTPSTRSNQSNPHYYMTPITDEEYRQRRHDSLHYEHPLPGSEPDYYEPTTTHHTTADTSYDELIPQQRGYYNTQMAEDRYLDVPTQSSTPTLNDEPAQPVSHGNREIIRVASEDHEYNYLP